MRRALIPFVVVVGLASAGLSATEVIDEQNLAYTEEVEYDPLAAEFDRREVEIATEIIDGSPAAWAGEYHFGVGFGTNVTLVIAPDHGFAVSWTGCVGVCGRSFGSVTQQGDRLLLYYEMSNPPAMFGDLSNVLVPVRRGEQLYLVAEEQMEEFSRAGNWVYEDCPDHCGRFLLRDGWDRMAERIPKLAAQYSRESSDRPLYVRVTRVIEPDLDPVDGDFRWRKEKVELDVGRDGGVWEGMEFFSSTAGWITDTITVDKVNATSSVATVSAYDQLPIPVQPGTCVSTYYDDSIDLRIYGRSQEGCDDGV